jgi:hypothetical protein
MDPVENSNNEKSKSDFYHDGIFLAGLNVQDPAKAAVRGMEPDRQRPGWTSNSIQCVKGSDMPIDRT